jgi:nicotinamidase-related amidase
MRSWQTVFPEEDRKVYEKAQFGSRTPFGHRPALMIIDVTYAFVGTRPQAVLQAVEEFRTSCGDVGWDAIPRIRRLLEAARGAAIPRVFTKGDPEYKAFCGGSTKGSTPEDARRLHSEDIPTEIAPRDDEFVLRKTKASVFFGTPLATYLHGLGVDTLLICGTSTSGCVRASVVDAFSHGYRVFVVEEGCFDRASLSHLVSLYEMNAKYADVITLDDALRYVASFDARARQATR